MKVGDLIKSKIRYNGQKFLLVGIRDMPAARGWIGPAPKQVKSIRMPDGFKTRWSNIETWEIVSESR